MKFYISKIKNILFYFIPFALGCYIYATPVVIILFILTWLFEGNLKAKMNALIGNKLALLFTTFYLLHLIGMLYSSNKDFGWFDLQIKLSILLFPIILVSEGAINFKRQKRLTEVFAAGLVLNGLICIGHAIYLYATQDKIAFEYKDFSLFLHPSYFSMYIDLALVLLFNLITQHLSSLRKVEKVLLYSASLFFIFLLILLQSKTGLITSVIILFIIVLRYILITKSWLTGMGIVVATVLLISITIRFLLPLGPSRFQSVSNIIAHNMPVDKKSVESSQARVLVWRAAWQVINNSPIVGVGTGDVKDALVAQYARDNYTGILKERLNAHNEYLQVTVALGIVGLICLLSCLLIPFYISIKEKRFVYLLFIVILLVNFATESVLETQGGTIFYGFFNSLLMFNFVI